MTRLRRHSIFARTSKPFAESVPRRTGRGGLGCWPPDSERERIQHSYLRQAVFRYRCAPNAGISAAVRSQRSSSGCPMDSCGATLRLRTITTRRSPSQSRIVRSVLSCSARRNTGACSTNGRPACPRPHHLPRQAAEAAGRRQALRQTVAWVLGRGGVHLACR